MRSASLRTSYQTLFADMVGLSSQQIVLRATDIVQVGFMLISSSSQQTRSRF